MVDGGFLMITGGIVDDTEVNVGEELASDISDLLVLGVEVDGILVILWLGLSDFHVVDADAVVGESFTMHIADGFADLEELLVLVDCELELSEVVIEDTS